MKFFILLLLTMSSAYSQDNCGSSDKRSMVDQLDCFCATDNKSVVQQKIDKLGKLGKALRNQGSNDCHSAIVQTLISSKDNKINSNISQKLKSLNYSDEQINKTLTPLASRINTAKIIKDGSCNKASISISIWPFSYKSSESDECAAIKKMPQEERDAAMMLAFAMNPIIKPPTSFTDQFKELDEATKLVEIYPESRILKCLELTKTINATIGCSNSKADDNKIDSCTTLGLGPTNSINCLQSNADAAGIKACKYLALGETNTINCLQINPDAQIVRTCKFLDFGETNTMKCLDIKPEVKVAEFCKFLDFGETNTVNCLNVKPSEQVSRSCKLLEFGETNTMNCLQLKPSEQVSKSCKLLDLGETNTMNCLQLQPNVAIAESCRNLNLGETNTISCLRSGVAPEKIHQCGLKNLSESKTIACLSESFNEKPASSQVSDIPRAPKEWTDEEYENSGSASKPSSVSK